MADCAGSAAGAVFHISSCGSPPLCDTGWLWPSPTCRKPLRKSPDFSNLLNKLGGMRLKYRITAGDGAHDPEGFEARQIYVELAGPDAPLGSLTTTANCSALSKPSPRKSCASILRSTTRSVSTPAISRLCAPRELRLAAETAAEKVRQTGLPYSFPAHEQPRAPPLAPGLPCSLQGVETASVRRRPQPRFLVVYPAGKTNLPVTPPVSRATSGC